MKYRITLFFSILLNSLCFHADAQKLLWDLDFHGFFDNREFKAPYQTPQTFFGSRISPSVGVEIVDEHQLFAGMSWLQEFGSNKDQKIDWSIYYRYNGTNLKASFGSFPRHLLAEELPGALRYDSINYFNPYIKGALFQYFWGESYVEAYIDWLSKQSKSDREVFAMVSNSRLKQGVLIEGWNFSATHFAKPRESEEENVFDHVMFNPYIGVDLSHRTVFDSLQIKTGALISFNRDRGDMKWHCPSGFWSEVVAEWRFLGIRNIVYMGKDQLTFFDRFGSQLHYSDPFYRAPFYDRLDLYGYLVRNKYVECKAACNIHFADGKAQFQQQLLLKFYINQQAAKNSKLKNIVNF